MRIANGIRCKYRRCHRELLLAHVVGVIAVSEVMHSSPESESDVLFNPNLLVARGASVAPKTS